jgi:hypothetical protein
VNVRRKIFSICSILLVLLVSIAVLVPSCAPTTGTIKVKATLDGSAWTGAVQYTLTAWTGTGAGSSINGTSVDASYSVDPGIWACAYASGGPAGASFVNITVNITTSTNQTVIAGGTVTFTLNFVTPQALDHFKCYWAQQGTSVNVDVQLKDQFYTGKATVTDPWYFCNPTKKTYDGEVTEILNPDHHLTLYGITGVTTQKWVVEVDNQFGKQKLQVEGPVMLAVPTQKEGHDEPVGLDHYLVYSAVGMGPDLNVVVQLEDQFNLEPQVTVLRPFYFANPVQKTDAAGMVTEIENPLVHLVFYDISETIPQIDVNVVDQFGEQTFSLSWSQFLAVPSEKLSFGSPPPLDHFKFYEVVGGPDADVVLPKVGDQFYTGVQEVEVQSLRYFGNPVAKTDDGVLTPIEYPNYHLTLYDITTPTIQNWVVEVDNQFGRQELTVSGPVMLAVPTWKEGHGWPRWLDHFLLYKVIEGEDVQVTVDLEDQWHKESDVEVHRPVYFANPAGKINPYVDWGPNDPLIIQNPDEHLVFYEIVGESYQGNVQIRNQLLVLQEEWETLSVSDPELLAVPSEKISFEQVEQPLELDHFQCYWIYEGASLVPGVVLSLKDQFVDIEVELGWPIYFCNPVEKVYEGVVTPILDPDHHLTIYEIYYQQEPQYWEVEVSNQFGKWGGSASWPMIVRGPVALAVPTQKLVPGDHNPPVGLDHFLLYEVSVLPDWSIFIDSLSDQFGYQQNVGLTAPYYFANPVRKTDASGMVTEIQNPQAHLLFHTIMAQPYAYPPLQIVNQFGEQFFPNVWGPYLVAAPTVKLSAEQVPPQLPS